MSDHKTPDQLAEICECAKHSYQFMERQLKAFGIPHLPRSHRGLWPLVSVTVYDSIIRGKEVTQARPSAPDFEALKAA